MSELKKIAYEAHHRFEWSPVVAGSIVALAITIVLVQFGVAIGYSGEVDIEDKSITHWSIVALGLWILLVQLISSLIGGYIAGYTRSVSPEIGVHDNEMRDGFYGLAVWATGTLAVFIGTALFGAFTAALSVSSETIDVIEALTDRQENAIIISGFVIGAVSCVSAGVAWWASVMGGHHRAHGTDFGGKFSFLK